MNRLYKSSLRVSVAAAFIAIATFISLTSQAATLSIREINIKEKNKIDIQFDGVIAKNALNIDFIRDNVQFSFINATIYPAKMIHAEDSTFNKIFAYQYSPSLVRIRFTVEGLAENFSGKVKWEQRGKVLSITFPDVAPVAAVKSAAPIKTVTPEKSAAASEKNTASAQKAEVIDEQKERSLLSRVLGRTDSTDSSVDETKNEKNASAAAPIAPITTVKKTPMILGGAKPGPSALRSFLALFLIVGGLGVVLYFVKRKKSAIQAKIVGKTWWSNFLPSSMRKPKSFIEVMGNHSLGPKQSLVVVRIRGQQFVLGVTQDNVQLITQLDADETEVDLLGDPAVSESIGIMFGGKPTAAQVTKTSPASFNAILNSSTGAGAIIGRNAYEQQTQTITYAEEGLPVQVRTSASAPVIVRAPIRNEPSVRDLIRKRLDELNGEGMRDA